MRLNEYGPWRFTAQWNNWLGATVSKHYPTPHQAEKKAKAKKEGRCRAERQIPISGEWKTTWWYFPHGGNGGGNGTFEEWLETQELHMLQPEARYQISWVNPPDP